MKNFKSIFFIIILLPLTIMSCGDNSKVSQEMKNLETSVNECISEINELNGDIKVKECLLKDIKILDKERKIGPVISKRIYNYLFC